MSSVSPRRRKVEKSVLSLADFPCLQEEDQTVLVCGCGVSLKEFAPEELSRFTTIGVNDVGRYFDPDFLLVLNRKSQFQADRFHYIQNSRAKHLVTHLDLEVAHPCEIRFRLGKKNGTDLGTKGVLPYTRNSPFVAIGLALQLGARQIGLIGVDFTDDHFFAKTGEHVLSKTLGQINQEFGNLNEECLRRGVRVYNLSKGSQVTAFQKVSLSLFEQISVSSEGSTMQPIAKPRISKIPMPSISASRWKKVRVPLSKGGIIGDLYEAISVGAEAAGFVVDRSDSTIRRGEHDALSVVWNGRRHRPGLATLFCEHGWLPRSAYQVSWQGINADHHRGPFSWSGQKLTKEEDQNL